MRLHLTTALISWVLALSATNALAQTPVPRIDYRELSRHSIEIYGLKIAIQKFNAGLFSMNLTNTTGSFIAFASEDMALVDKGGSQLFLRSVLTPNGLVPSTLPRLRIAPGATVHLEGRLNDYEAFPVEMYFFDTLCAIVTAEQKRSNNPSSREDHGTFSIIPQRKAETE